MILFFSDWESSVTESDLDFRDKQQCLMIRPPSNMVRFIELVN